VNLEQHDGAWALSVVTPIMRRVQKTAMAKEVCFIDSTSHLDTTHCTLTSMSVASKAGALPIGLLLHGQQTKDNYLLAFGLFKRTYPNAFGGEQVKNHS
jgi:hypothetical protein